MGLTVPSSCVTCPYYKGNNPSQSQIATALANAAATYGLPVNLLKAVAWQESHWHEDVISCDGGIGLMQVQYYVYPWLNTVSVPDCTVSADGKTHSNNTSWINATSYDPYTVQGNADLGAKYLAYLACYYGYWGGYNYDINGNPHVLSNPSKYTVAWYYAQAGLQYPDTKNADGSTNTNSLCAAVYNDPTRPEFAAMSSTIGTETWSCPYSATAGDNTLLDMVVSAYNAGPGVTNNGINNMWYVNGVEGYIPQFASGALP